MMFKCPAARGTCAMFCRASNQDIYFIYVLKLQRQRLLSESGNFLDESLNVECCSPWMTTLSALSSLWRWLWMTTCQPTVYICCCTMCCRLWRPFLHIMLPGDAGRLDCCARCCQLLSQVLQAVDDDFLYLSVLFPGAAGCGWRLVYESLQYMLLYHVVLPIMLCC
jgi:hypothetical protein